MLERLPSRLLRLEALAVLVTALVVYFDAGFGWVLLVVLFLAPDASIAAFVAGPSVGAAVYNLVHTYVFPLALAIVGVLGDIDWMTQVALVWAAHIGMDRFVGYGLKYPSGFKRTHLQRI